MKQFFPRVAALVAERSGVAASDIEALLQPTKNVEHGDVALPCFKLAKDLETQPAALAAELAQKIGHTDLVQSCEAAGPFVNFRLRPEALAREVVSAAFTQAAYGASNVGGGKTVVMDFSSPNIAKPFHLGHLRSTVIGWSIRQLLRAQGYAVVGVNHLGDWGTQFGLMIAAWTRWKDEAERRLAAGERDTDVFVDLYVRINKLKKDAPRIADEGRGWFKKLEQGDAEARRLWQFFVERSKTEFARIYALLGITHESDAGESFYEDKMAAIVAVLERHGLLIEGQSKQEQLQAGREDLEASKQRLVDLEASVASAADAERKKKQKELDKARAKVAEKAKAVKTLEAQLAAKDADDDAEDEGPADQRPRGVDLGALGFAIVIKADGGTNYTTRDLAAAKYRAEHHAATTLLYVVGNTQRDHFIRLFKIIDLLAQKGEPWAQQVAGRLHHVGFGNYLGMKTREGGAVFLDAVLERAREAARVAADSAEKKIQLTEAQREQVARTIGTAAVKFFDLRGNRTNDIDLTTGQAGEIDWDRLLNLKGDSGPYLQFAHARLAGILRKHEDTVALFGVRWELLGDAEAQALIRSLADFPHRVAQAASELEPSIIARYLLELSTRIHGFIHERRVLNPKPDELPGVAPADLTRARVLLVAAAKKVLAEGLELLGIEAPEQM
jgi:arginyl-tRNA synthetase